MKCSLWSILIYGDVGLIAKILEGGGVVYFFQPSCMIPFVESYIYSVVVLSDNFALGRAHNGYSTTKLKFDFSMARSDLVAEPSRNK